MLPLRTTRPCPDPIIRRFKSPYHTNVVSPIGTANSAHLVGIDFAGKTGSAQTISNALKAKIANGKTKFKDNGWFVGVEPRRSPEIVVAALLEEGEHSVTVDLTISYLRPLTTGTARASAKILREGRRIIVLSAEVLDNEGKIAATALSTYLRVKNR